MMSKKMLFLALLIWITITANVKAQVNIGSNNVPHTGAVLDLSQTLADLGLLLPNIKLNDVSILQVAGDAEKAKGMVIYNTLTNTKGGVGIGLYIWDGGKWRALAVNGGSMAINPIPGTVDKNGGDTPTITVTSPGAEGFTGDYTFAVISGNEFAEVNPSASADGKFSITFQPNNSAIARRAVVLVTDPAGNTATFVFDQEANDALCSSGGTKNPDVTQTGTLGTNGAVYFSIAVEPGAAYVWTYNGTEVATGATYMATRPGNYIVYGGAVGCTNQSSVTLPTPTATSPDPVISVVSSNGGVVCGGTVALTALSVPSGSELQWFKDGFPIGSPSTNTTIQVSEAGNYFVAMVEGTRYSYPSNISTVSNGGTAGKVNLDPSDVKINGIAIDAFNSYCKGSSLYLTVDGQLPGIDYTWYNGNDVIANTNPYVVPTTQDALMLRLVATDRSGALCPAEQNHAENAISSTAPVAATITGDDKLCSGGVASLTAMGADNAAAYQWYLNGVLQPAYTGQVIHQVPSAGSYTVRYSQSGGCMSNLSAPFVVSAQGAPAIEWDQFVADINDSDTYTFSVRSTGSSAPTAYTWTATNSTGTVVLATVNSGPASDLAGITGNSVSLKFSDTGQGGSITLSVTPANSCGKGTPITKLLTMQMTNLEAPIVSPTSGSFCGGVMFMIKKPDSWTTQDWTAFGSSNIVEVKLDNYNTTGNLTTDGKVWYYYVAATSGSAQTASITVGGKIGAIAITPATAAVQINTNNTAGNFTVNGANCFDINRSNISGRVKADFSRTYVYSLKGTLSGATITNVVWTYKNVSGAIQSITAAPTSPTVQNNQVTVKYDPALLNNSSIGAAGIQIIITATITTSGGTCPNATYTAEIPVIIRDAACCEGALISKGAYTSTATSHTGQAGAFSSGWVGNYTASDKDLCWAKKNAGSGKLNITDATTSCTGNWRLPNLRELHELYKALGGNGSTAISFANLVYPNVNQDATSMSADGYWSSTPSGNGFTYAYGFTDGFRTSNRNTGTTYVRCVREF